MVRPSLVAFNIFILSISSCGIIPTPYEIASFIKANAKSNDIVLTLGAGTVTEIGPKILNS